LAVDWLSGKSWRHVVAAMIFQIEQQTGQGAFAFDKRNGGWFSGRDKKFL
jgi:hypothetical protein